jgi:hypothetical protein
MALSFVVIVVSCESGCHIFVMYKESNDSVA